MSSVFLDHNFFGLRGMLVLVNPECKSYANLRSSLIILGNNIDERNAKSEILTLTGTQDIVPSNLHFFLMRVDKECINTRPPSTKIENQESYFATSVEDLKVKVDCWRIYRRSMWIWWRSMRRIWRKGRSTCICQEVELYAAYIKETNHKIDKYLTLTARYTLHGIID